MTGQTADDYGRVLAASGRWRVVRCKDDVQFIVQERARTAAERPWRARAYVYSATALCVVLQRRSMGIPSEDLVPMLAILERLGTDGGTNQFSRAIRGRAE